MRPTLHLLFFLVPSFLYAQPTSPHLIPQPVDMQSMNGTFRLLNLTRITYDGPSAKAVADGLADDLARPTGFALRAAPNQIPLPEGIHLRLNRTADTTLHQEGYALVVVPSGVTITANQPAGLYYGVQTLRQLLPADIESGRVVNRTWTIPAVRIIDYPRFGWRGIMFDVSRHFFTKEQVKRYIDELARLKYNTFHWHLTDDEGWRIEIKALPRLTQVGAWRVPRQGKWGQLAPPKPSEAATDGGFYTQDDIREVVRYAQDRHVTIVPEIDVPGHSMAALAAYPNLSCTKDTSTRVNPGTKFAEWYPNGTFKMLIDNTLNPSDEAVYKFLDKVFTEVAPLFPGQYVHVGGDECYKGYWEKDAGCQALMKRENMKHVEELQGYFMKRVEQILKTKGKKLLGWDEILEGGLAPEATVMSWRGIKGGIEAARLGHDVVMTPTTNVYIDYMQSDPTLEPPIYGTLRLKTCYDFEPVPAGVDAKRILGGQANLWTEGVPTFAHAEYMTWPRGWALADVYWSPKRRRDWTGFVPRMETQFVRADRAGINYARSAYDAIVIPALQNGLLTVTMTTEISGVTIYYTLDDTVPSVYANAYTQPIAIADAPVTLRVMTYRNGQPIGRLITLKRDDLLKRVKKS